MGLDHPHVDAWFRGMYESFFRALEARGHTVTLSISTPNTAADVLVVPMGEHQDRSSAKAMAAFPGPVILYSGAAKYWCRKDFIARWRDKILFAYATDFSEYGKKEFADSGIAYYTMPFASDPDVMRPLDLPKLYDVVFAGNATSGKGRHDFVAPLMKRIDRRKALFIGPGWEQYGLPFHSVAWGGLLNVLYNLGTVCINLLNEEQNSVERRDANNRLFDLASAGCMQVSNAPRVVREYFSAQEVIAAETPAEWLDAVFHFIAHPEETEQYRVQARERALRDHTWSARADAFSQLIAGALEQRPAAVPSAGITGSLLRRRDMYLPPYGIREFSAKVGRKITRVIGR